MILLGPPASGKGTQARQLAGYLGVPCLGTGKLLRDEIERETAVGLEAKGYIEGGSYVPDAVILAMVESWLGENVDGWLMDGFPRTIPQAEALQESAIPPSRVIVLDVPRGDLELRITRRRECTGCGVTFAVDHLDEVICPDCKTPTLVSRADDALDSFKVRYENYEELTVPLFDYYEGLGMLDRVDGTQSPDEVFAEILKLVGG